MENIPENSLPVIGRVKTVIVLESESNPIGVVSEIVVRSSSDNKAERLVFRGPVKCETSVLKHLDSIVLPLADRILDGLHVARKNYEVSVVNLGATASQGIGIKISGFSADLPLLIALLSSSLEVAVRQEVVSTGHVASLEGDLAPVRGIPAKLDAIRASEGITAFVLPALEKDRSLKRLTPVEYRASREALLRHKGDLRIYSISGVSGAIKILMTDESILLGSLSTGFFNAKTGAMISENPISTCVALLGEGNEKRFWDVLETTLLNRRAEKARLVLRSYADFHIKRQYYPENFGEQLLRLVASLPPSTRKLSDLFPLISMDLCIKLSQHAKKSDHEDVRQLYKAAFGEGFSSQPFSVDRTESTQSQGGFSENDLVEMLLAELSEENLAKKVGLPFDEARASYVTPTVTIKDGFGFNDGITAFCAHMFRHTASPEGHMNQAALSAEAIALVRKTFENKGGYKAALAEGKHGTNGGMRLVFDAMTESLKQEAKEKYIARVFKEISDPLDWDARVNFTKAFMERIMPELPDDLKSLSPERLASHLETIIQYYVKSKAKVSDLLKRL